MHLRQRSAAEAKAVGGATFDPVPPPTPTRTRNETKVHRAAQLEVTGGVDHAGRKVAPCARCAVMYASAALSLDGNGRLVCRRCRSVVNG